MKGLNLRKPFTETPSSVRKEYDAQIEAFLQGFEDRPRSSIFGPGPLDLLFEYTKRASNLSKQYQGEKDKETIARRKAEEMVANLQKDVRHLGKKGDNLRAQVEERDEWMTGLAKQHSKEEEKWRQQKEAMTRAHIEEKNKLISQLLVNSDDSQGWADEKLKVKFQDLQRQIEKIASPNRKEFRLATGQILDTKIDPTGFVQRSGPGRLHLLLKSLLWNVYREQLFSAPFGFGVLGQGDGKQKLLDLISSWRSLVDPNGLRSYPASDTFGAFRIDRRASNWRSSTFQSIAGSIINDEGRGPTTSSSQVATLYQSNIDHTVQRIINLLQKISWQSGIALSGSIDQDIRHATKLAGEFALQCGLHPAQLILRFPQYNEKVLIGGEFHEYGGGSSREGVQVTVDLLVHTGLFKIGDGRSDHNVSRCIVPCEIYARE